MVLCYIMMFKTCHWTVITCSRRDNKITCKGIVMTLIESLNLRLLLDGYIMLHAVYNMSVNSYEVNF